VKLLEYHRADLKLVGMEEVMYRPPPLQNIIQIKYLEAKLNKPNPNKFPKTKLQLDSTAEISFNPVVAT
jgi:hypothetical protein